MRSNAAGLLMLTGLVAGVGCYRDALGPPADLVSTTVLLTDAPFPLDLVDRVEVYVTQVAASMTADTLPAAQRWWLIAEPRRRYDLLALQGGITAIAGVGRLPAGRYGAMRLIVNGDSSRVVLHDGRTAHVRWPAAGEVVVPALVEQPLDVDGGTTLVLDFDLGRSFGYNVDPLFDFVFSPVVRAVRADRTGLLAGTVRGDPGGVGVPQPITDAIVTLYHGDVLASASSWWVAAAGRTDASGSYRVGFLLPGSYIVRLEAPWSPRLEVITVPEVTIRLGEESRLDVTLPAVAGMISH